MPLDVTPSTITLDKVRIEQFTVSPQLNAVMVQYSRGYDDANGQYVPKEYANANFMDVSFDQSLYDQVKSALYVMLSSYLNQ
jgi:hypothetical protein